MITRRERVSHWRATRREGGLAVLEGFHAVKHAARFGAVLEELVTEDPAALLALARSLAPDLQEVFAGAEPVSPEVFRELVPSPPGTGVLALARKAPWTLSQALGVGTPGATVLLDRPSHLGNVGAVIRNAAGLGAKGVVVVSESDPWHPDVVRGAAGLHYALPVVSVPRWPSMSDDDPSLPLVAMDPDGAPLHAVTMPPSAMLAFGAERDGVSAELKERAELTVALPMREGVSSLNLASTVGIALYAWRHLAR